MSRWGACRRSSASAMPENLGAGGARAAAKAPRAGKRAALGDLTNVLRGGGGGGRFGAAGSAAHDAKLSSTKSVDVKKGTFASFSNVNMERGSTRKPISDQFDRAVSHVDTDGSGLDKGSVSHPSVPIVVPEHGSSAGLSEDSFSMDDAMSTCCSMGSPDRESLDDGDLSMATSLDFWTNDKLHISDKRDVVAFNWRKHAPIPMKTEAIFDVDSKNEDPQLSGALAWDIYEHLREAETKKMPSTNFLEITQTTIIASMRAVLIDWLVEVTEEYRLDPETLYLTVNYVDRYLSVKDISKHRKFEEICPPQVEELCYITDNSYTKDEVLQMEASVLNHLKFEMSAPTAKCFLRRFVRVAQACNEGPVLHLEFIANYICELSLLEYSLLCYLPSLVAASSVFLAEFILKPTKNPWNSTLSYYTQYTPSELHGCVRVLHQLFCVGPGINLPAIREKYSQHKYKFVAKKYCPPSIPIKFFQDATT
ncbi:hypothetical protein ACP4OV_016437 [Aristida adscensionis]